MSIICAGEGGPDSTVPFGESNLLVTGDFHQKALYALLPFNHHCKIGCNLFLQFQMVIFLTQQM
jgi:hypothetical protein